MKNILYVCDADSGGIMEYAIRQSAALVDQGVEVHFLCEETFPKERLAAGIVALEFPVLKSPGWARGKFRTIWMLALRQRQKSKRIVEICTAGNFDAILFACFKEYFAPFWVGPLRSLARKGVRIGTIAHDPIRDFVLGPLWWHRWSVRLAYSFVRHVFVHDKTPVDFGGKQPKGIKIHEIPHGPYDVSEPKIGRLEMRRRFGFDSCLTTIEGNGAYEPDTLSSNLSKLPISESRIHSEDAPASLPPSSYSPFATPAPPDIVFLAFGQIRDGKNLDLFLHAMTRLPLNVKLLVAGKGDSGSSKPPAFYQKLAEELGVAERCRWDIRRIPEDEVGDIFAACDFVLVIYNSKFRSASGVLNLAVSAKKPILASSGEGPLKSVVEKFRLGVFLQPDNEIDMVRGVHEIINSFSIHSRNQSLINNDNELSANSLIQSEKKDRVDADRVENLFLCEWDLYNQENSWIENTNKICRAFKYA